MNRLDTFGCRQTLAVDGEVFEIVSLEAFSKKERDISRLPYSIRIMLENLLRHEDNRFVRAEDIRSLACGETAGTQEIAFTPARVLMQDFTGVPAVVDLAAMRDAMKRLGGDPSRINPQVPVDLVVDHSIMVDAFGSETALDVNAGLEYQRNRERYEFLRWGQNAFRNFRVVPPGAGICHQVNLEFLAGGVLSRPLNGRLTAFPDTLVGTDSHTTMINGLGVVGWGVGGIEAEAAMLGQPLSMLIPEVVGFKLTGALSEGATATDLVLTITQMLRKKGVVGKFVEYFGSGVEALSVADRATIANMAPEYGATIGYFTIDAQTLRYLELTNRPPKQVRLVEAYTKAQGLFRTPGSPDPRFADTLELDLSSVEPSMAGPKRPQDRVLLRDVKSSWAQALPGLLEKKSKGSATVTQIPRDKQARITIGGQTETLTHGAVALAAITSCTNTSNPSVMIGAGLVAKKAVEKGLRTKPWVKTSLAPGSKVVTDYLRKTRLMSYLGQLGFHTVGYGCTTCIGNSGPLPEPVSAAVKEHDVIVAAVLSGNRNFEGRINPLIKANYLASPPLVVAFALAGHIDFDPDRDPLGQDRSGQPVFLKDIWPTQAEVQAEIARVSRDMFSQEYGKVFDGDDRWRALPVAEGRLFDWNTRSSYVKHPPYFDGLQAHPSPLRNIINARVLAVLGDSVTTDHISPAGSIPKDSPAGKYLISRGVDPKDFNSYGARRGHDEVMVRGTFANIRLKNLLAPGTEGGWTRVLPDGDVATIYEASVRYRASGTPLIVLAGKEYGSGSSRDWAAKGPALLGVRAVIAESFERIHRSNLVGMGILPLQFLDGETRTSLGLTGEEQFTIEGVADHLSPKTRLQVRTTQASGAERSFQVIARIDTPVEIDYYRHGGILPYVLRQLLV